MGNSLIVSVTVRRPRRTAALLFMAACALQIGSKLMEGTEPHNLLVRHLLTTRVGPDVSALASVSELQTEELLSTLEAEFREVSPAEQEIQSQAQIDGDSSILSEQQSSTDTNTNTATPPQTRLRRPTTNTAVKRKAPTATAKRRQFNTDLLPSDENEIVDVMICSDSKTINAMVAAVASVVENTKAHPYFHLVVPPTLVNHATEWVLHYYPNITMEVIPFRGEALEQKIIVRGRRKELGSPLNFARFFIPTLFPKLKRRLVFIDDDTIVRGDIRELRDVHIPEGKVAAFSTDTVNKLSMFLNFQNPKIKELRLNKNDLAFNAGVFVADTVAWKEHQITEKLLELMTLNIRTNIYGGESGGGVSQPPMLIALHNRTSELPENWHVRHFGWQQADNYSIEFVSQAKLLHWNGKSKPWGSRGKWMGVWYQYYRPDPKGLVVIEPSLRRKGLAAARTLSRRFREIESSEAK